jgi:hypothetical protein
MSANPSGYIWRPGKHCASSALRDVASFVSGGRTVFSEEFIFGAGCGADTIACELGDRRYFVNGRSSTFVEDAATALGWKWHEGHTSVASNGTMEFGSGGGGGDDDDEPSSIGRAAVNSMVDFLSSNRGSVAFAFGDTYYMPHFTKTYRRGHFPGHAFVVTGIDREQGVAFIAERNDARLNPMPLSELALAMDPPGSLFSTKGRWLWFESCEPLTSVNDVAKLAMKRQADRFFRTRVQSRSVLATGREGLAVLQSALEKWAASNTSRDVKRFVALANVFEARGTGGGNFRLMYGAFLAEVEASCSITSETFSRPARDAAKRYTAMYTIAQRMAAMNESAAEDDRLPLWRDAIENVKAAALHEQLLHLRLGVASTTGIVASKL